MVVITDGHRILGRTISIKEVSFGYAFASVTDTKKALSIPSIDPSTVRPLSSTEELADYLEESQIATFLGKIAGTISPGKTEAGETMATEFLDWLRH